MAWDTVVPRQHESLISNKWGSELAQVNAQPMRSNLFLLYFCFVSIYSKSSELFIVFNYTGSIEDDTQRPSKTSRC